MNQVIIGIGSNLPDGMRIVESCCDAIRGIVASSKFSSCYETAPVSAIRQPNYHNCVGIIETDKAYEELRAIFKAMEVRAGRTKGDKLRGIVALDVDIVKWNDEIISERDMVQDYMQIGLRQLAR